MERQSPVKSATPVKKRADQQELTMKLSKQTSYSLSRYHLIFLITNDFLYFTIKFQF